MPHDFKLWCEDCQKGYEGECEEHGPLTHVSDTEVGTRARRSLPHLLKLQEGKIRTGVFAREKLAKRLQFGPLQAIVERDSRNQLKIEEEIRNKYGIVYKLVQDDDDLFLLDTRFEEHSNWMIFVKPAERKSEQNLVAFQYKGEIFFATIKEIPAQCELKVWFSRDYAERMGAGVLSDEGTSWQFRARQRFSCLGCGVVFSNTSNLANHRCPKSKQKGKIEGFPSRKRIKRTIFPRRSPSPVASTSQLVKLEEVVEEEFSPKIVSSQVLRGKKRGPRLKERSKYIRTSHSSDSENGSALKSPEKVGTYQCPVCEKVFHSPGKLKQHSYSHTGERPFSCPHCQKAFSSRFKLGRHQLIHTSERQHQCPLCNRSFHRKDHLKNHIQIHDPNKQFKCERAECGKEYNSYMSYRKHCAVHAAEEGDLECKICLEMFDTKADLIYHLKVHVGTRTVKSPSEKKFQCDQCERRFFTRKDVKRHLVVHTGKRDFVCSLCPQKFGRKDHLVRHIKKSHGVPDPSRLEPSSGAPLSVAGPSSAPQALSPDAPSTSASSGDHSLSSLLMGEALPGPEPKMFGVSTLPPPTVPYQAGPFPPELRFFEETIKEEPELTASMESIGPGGDDISRMLGMYLPAGPISLPVPALLEATGAGPQEESLDPIQPEAESLSPLLLRETSMFEEEVSLPLPTDSSSEEYTQVCSLIDPVSSPESGGGVVVQPSQSGIEAAAPPVTSPKQEDQTSPQNAPTTTTASGGSSSSSSLPGFKHTFP